MTRVADTMRSSREETLSRDVDALHRQVNTLALRLARAQERVKQLEEENAVLREAHEEICRAFDSEQKKHDPEWPHIAGYAKGTARRALNGDVPAALNGGGDGDA